MTRDRILRVLAAAAMLGAAGSATVVLHRDHDTPPTPPRDAVTGAVGHRSPPRPATAKPTSGTTECETVDGLAKDWMAPAPQGESDDQHSERLAEKARAAADSVSSPAIQRDLNLWADGFSLLAEAQRLSADPAAGDSAADVTRAQKTITLTADALRQACPDGWPAQP